MQIIKIDESTLEVTKDAPVVEPTKQTYTIDFLKEQELNILKQMNDYNEARQVELIEVRALLAEAVNLGLKTKQQLQAEAVIAEENALIDN